MKKRTKLSLFILISILFFILMNGKLFYQYSDFKNYKIYLKILLSLIFGYILIYQLFIFKKQD
jgi:glucan phosphoethanolaminetransferase (alkaline phosphatase superfamily)